MLPAQSPGKPISWKAPMDLGNFLPVTESSCGTTLCCPDAELSQEPASCLFGFSVEMLFLLHKVMIRGKEIFKGLSSFQLDSKKAHWIENKWF